jgi:hypothetical protein
MYLRNKQSSSSNNIMDSVGRGMQSSKISIENLVKSRIFDKTKYSNSSNKSNEAHSSSSTGNIVNGIGVGTLNPRSTNKTKKNPANNFIQSKLRNKLFGSSMYNNTKGSKSSHHHFKKNINAADCYNGSNNTNTEINGAGATDEAVMSYVNRLNMINENNNILYVNENAPGYYYKDGDSDEEIPNNDNMFYSI